MGCGTIRYSAEDVPSQQESILREKITAVWQYWNLSTLAGHCEADVVMRSAGRPAARHSAWYAI